MKSSARARETEAVSGKLLQTSPYEMAAEITDFLNECRRVSQESNLISSSLRILSSPLTRLFKLSWSADVNLITDVPLPVAKRRQTESWAYARSHTRNILHRGMHSPRKLRNAILWPLSTCSSRCCRMSGPRVFVPLSAAHLVARPKRLIAGRGILVRSVSPRRWSSSWSHARWAA